MFDINNKHYKKYSYEYSLIFDLYICFVDEEVSKGIRQIAHDNRITSPRCKKYMIDIDGTICLTRNSDYKNSIPFQHNIDIFNKLYEMGNEVNYWTARGANSGKNWDEFTIEQLKSWNVKYTSLNMDKPHYDVWIDDKAINANDARSVLMNCDRYIPKNDNN